MSGRENAGPTPTAAFEVLGNETRLAIIEALAKPRRTEWRFERLGFAELRRAVGIADAGTFNYHLGKLRDHFVVKDGDEYVLTNAGFYLAGAIRAGTYTERVEPRRTDTDRECPVCGTEVEAVYEAGFFRIECLEHGIVGANALPPGAALDREMDDLVALADRDSRRMAEDVREGVCPHCWGSMETTAPVGPSKRMRTGGATDLVCARGSCKRCGMTIWVPVWLCCVDHPAVTSFYWNHGFDAREQGSLERGFRDGTAGTVLEGNPVRIVVVFELDGNEFRVVLDETLAVVETTRDGS